MRDPVALRDGLWTEVTPSEHAHERAALNFVRERLPDREPFRGWSNFTFQADDGRRYEVDLLVATPTELFLVEVKSHPNRIDGDAGTWVWTTPDGQRRTFDNPLRLAESKAKKLKSLLLHQDAMHTKELKNRRGPDGRPIKPTFYVRALVFLSDPQTRVGLDELGRTDVFGPDRDERLHPDQKNDLDGIVARLTHVDAHSRNRIDSPLSRAIAKAVDQAGIRQSQALRQAGHYRLEELVAEGEGWQDFVALNPNTKDERRIRLYLTSRAQTEDERLALARAAEREYRFLKNVDHPGIEKPTEVIANPQGPALIFPHDRAARRLDHYLTEHADDLDLLDRVELVRQLAETLRAAHRAGLYHRALAPNHVTVSGAGKHRRLRIRDWQAAARELTATAMSSVPADGTGTSHVARLISEQAHLYVAPEVIRLGEGQPRAADVWSLGAVSYLILTGNPPAADLDGLYATLKEHDSLTLAAGMDAPDPELDEVIRNATKTIATDRFVSVDEFLDWLDDALEQMTREPERDPLDANRGDQVGDWKILKRFGSGSTSVVLLAERDDRVEVLKVARDEDHAARLRDEHDALTRLRTKRIVETYGIETIAGRTVLRLEAADQSLARQLEQQGPLSIDRLQRFGDDLLEALEVLEDEGIAHRDIKPDNLGMIERGKNKERHLVLFDFSLTRADATNLHAGTAAYLDPFLVEREPKRWDLHAERYAAAVTIHEMASGTRPVWGDGGTDPALVSDLDLPTLSFDVVDPALRGPLAAFLERALHRRPAERFDTASDMRQAWERVFREVDRPATLSDDGLSTADVDLSNLAADASIADIGLSPRILNVLERLGTATLADLAAVPAHELSRLSGVGAAVRREVAHLADAARRRFEDVPAIETSGRSSVDQLAELLVPKRQADVDQSRAVAALLGLVPEPVATWPSQRQVAEQAVLERSTVAEALTAARTRWTKRTELTQLRLELIDLLRARDGVAGADELAAALLATRGSHADEPVRSRRARALVRAALEAETTRQVPRFLSRRLVDQLLVALDGELPGDEGPESYRADELVDVAAELGEVADVLALEEPLPSPDRVVAELRQVPVPVPAGIGPFTDARLVRLAAAASTSAAVSSRLELYPVGMSPLRAVSEARPALLARHGLSAKDVRSRVRARFPEAAELPTGAALHRILEQAGTGLAWKAGGSGEPGRYEIPARGGVLATSFTSLSHHSTTYATPDERELARREVDDQLDRIRAEGGFLALSVEPARLAVAADAVAARCEAIRVDLDRWLVEEMQRQAEAKNARWVRILEADADPEGPNYKHVRNLVTLARPLLLERLTATGPLVVATGLGLLARYEQLDALERLREQLTRRGTAGSLEALVLLVPGTDPEQRPTIDGRAIPVVTPSQFGHLPSAWLEEQAA